jgi:hypothetical protein
MTTRLEPRPWRTIARISTPTLPRRNIEPFPQELAGALAMLFIAKTDAIALDAAITRPVHRHNSYSWLNHTGRTIHCRGDGAHLECP